MIKYTLLALILTLMVIAITTHTCAQGVNNLRLGQNAAVKSIVEINLEPVKNLNYKSRAEILNMRTNLVNQHANLLENQYIPNLEIFGQIVDNKPWWGVIGSCIYGSGNRSIEGPSEETRFLLNPFLLVGANSWSCEIFEEQKLTDSDLEKKDFPYFWQPTSLTYNLSANWARVVYDVSSFNNNLKKYQNLLKDNYEIRKFGLIAYNARDMGFNYIYTAKSKSVNVANNYNLKQAIPILHMIHCGGSCGYSGGCNNMSPAMPEIDNLEFTQLPARCVVYLWKNAPSSISQKPDFVFIIDLI